MSYEEQLNQDAMELTEETAAEAVEEVAEAAVTEETIEAEVQEVEAEPVADEAEEAPAEEEPVVEEELALVSEEEPAVDEDLFDLAADEDMDIEFEIEMPQEKVENRITEAMSQARGTLQSKYDEARTACKGMMQRITSDLEQTNYNPYIRSTTTYKYEILRNSKDTEPVDTFEFQRTSGFSLRAMAITSAIVAVADIAVAKLLKKKK